MRRGKMEKVLETEDTSAVKVTQPKKAKAEVSSDNLPIFSSLTFFLDGFNDEETEAYKESIIGFKGAVVDEHFKGVPDYVVVPVLNQPRNLPAVQGIVNELWLIRSIEEKRVCDINYFHKPMPTPQPLKDCVVTLSLYVRQEKQFLKSVVEKLGGIVQDCLSQKNNLAKNLLATTHLVSPEPKGRIYTAALAWNLPVVNKDWLLECARTATKVDVEQYLLDVADAHMTLETVMNRVL